MQWSRSFFKQWLVHSWSGLGALQAREFLLSGFGFRKAGFLECLDQEGACTLPVSLGDQSGPQSVADGP